jgi:AAA+ ATPase superfamily predicted ATPase
MLILCGSSVSFILGEVLSEKSPLFGRRTRSIHLQQFSLGETAHFFKGRNRFEIAEIYIACGGVPKYLEVMGTAPSFRAALKPLFFDPHGYFFEEVTFALSEQLKEKDRYFQLLRLMSQGIGEIAELERRTGIASGQVMYYLERLHLLGFVSRNTPIGSKNGGKRVVYTLTDYFLRFYFMFVFPFRSGIKRGETDAPLRLFNTKWDSYAGCAFERLAFDHAHLIVSKLGHGGSLLQAGAFWRKPTKRLAGVQIDLILVCEGNTTLVCECKWSRGKTGVAAAKELLEKVKIYPNPMNHTLKPVLVTAAGGTSEVASMKGISVVTLEDLS